MYTSGTLEYYFLKLPDGLLPSGGEAREDSISFVSTDARKTLTKGVFQLLSKAKPKLAAGLTGEAAVPRCTIRAYKCT